MHTTEQHEAASLSLTLDARAATARVEERGELASELLTRFLAVLKTADYKPRQLQVQLERSVSGAIILKVEADVPGLAETKFVEFLAAAQRADAPRRRARFVFPWPRRVLVAVLIVVALSVVGLTASTVLPQLFLPQPEVARFNGGGIDGPSSIVQDARSTVGPVPDTTVVPDVQFASTLPPPSAAADAASTDDRDSGGSATASNSAGRATAVITVLAARSQQEPDEGSDAPAGASTPALRRTAPDNRFVLEQEASAVVKTPTPAGVRAGDVGAPDPDMLTPSSTLEGAVTDTVPLDAFATTTVLYTQRFAVPVPGWPDNSNGTAWFGNRSYRLFARRAGNFVAVGAPLDGLPPGDVRVTARMTKIGGADGGIYGLIVRDQDPWSQRDGLNQTGDYIVFEVGDRGTIRIRQRRPSRWIDIVPSTQSDAVHAGRQSNDLMAIAAGTTLGFEVNGTLVTQLSYADMPLQGGVGVFVGGDNNLVALDWLRVEAPEGSQ